MEIKRYYQYSDADLANMSHADLINLIKLECLMEGIEDNSLVMPKPKRTIQPDVIVYEVRTPSYNSIVVGDVNIAQELMELLTKIKPYLLETNYISAGCPKYLSGIKYFEPSLESVPVFSEELYRQMQSAIKEESQAISAYEDASSKQDKDSKAHDEVYQKVMKRYRQAYDRLSKQEVLLKAYKNYFDTIRDMSVSKSDYDIHAFIIPKFFIKSRTIIVEAYYIDTDGADDPYSHTNVKSCYLAFLKSFTSVYANDIGNDDKFILQAIKDSKLNEAVAVSDFLEAEKEPVDEEAK